MFNPLHYAAAITLDWADLRLPVVFAIALLSALLVNRILERVTPQIARGITKRIDTTHASERFLQTRRMQTFLSLGVGITRVLVILVALVLAWNFTNPTTAPIALIGAGTVFAVLAGATLVPLLRDVTYGFIMIAERWYNVGDHVVIEPFPNLGGVVEQINLRSTKIRSINGETIWVHNQHVMAVRVSPAASHTMAIELFVNNPDRGTELIEYAARVLPISPITMPQPPDVTEVIEIEPNLWRITAICEVTPFREWIIEDFAVKVIRERDEQSKKPVLIHTPTVLYADANAEKRYRRSVRTVTPVLPKKRANRAK